MKLKGKVSIVTGGGQGIGYAISLRFAREGSYIVIPDIDADKAKKTCEAIKEGGGTAIFLKTDVTKPIEVEEMINKAIKEFGKINILVNNAGNRSITPLMEISDEEWDSMIRLNLTSVFLCSQRAIPYLEKEEGRIINISSIGGLAGFSNRASYCAAKAGVINLTRAMAIELASRKINVNCIAPGITLTPLTAHYATGHDSDSMAMRTMLNTIPLGRWGKPEEIAAAAVFLVSDEAEYITGITLPVDGGWSAR